MEYRVGSKEEYAFIERLLKKNKKKDRGFNPLL